MSFCAQCVNHIVFVFILFDHSLALCVSVCVCVHMHTHTHTHTHTHIHVQLLHCVQLFVTPLTVAGQAPLSMGFSRQEYWSRLLFPSPGSSPNPEMEPVSPALAGGFFTTVPPGKPNVYMCVYIYVFHCDSHYWLSTWINMSASSKLTLISIGND